MIGRPLRIVFAIAVTALSSGVPQAVMAALDHDCCAEPCDGPDGQQCPSNCQSVVCAKAHVSLRAVGAPAVGPQPVWSEAVVVTEAAPELPLVVTGLFHPPRA